MTFDEWRNRPGRRIWVPTGIFKNKALQLDEFLECIDNQCQEAWEAALAATALKTTRKQGE